MSYVELFDVACLLSRWEGFGLALPEYMMAGKPIVASRVDAIPNIIRNGENGLLVEVDDATGASEAVLQMTIYIPMIILTVFLADIQERIRYRGRKISILLITLLPPTLVAAFRYNNGADYPMYFQLFTRLGNGSKIAGIEGKKLEVGFEYIVRLCQLVTRNQWFTFGAISFIISFLIFKECLNDSDHYRLSVLFYFVTGVYFDAYNGLRQYIAVSICFYAMKYILNKDAKRYFLAVLIAFLFHKSALFFVPVYFLQYLKFDFKKAITIVGLTVLSGSGLWCFPEKVR